MSNLIKLLETLGSQSSLLSESELTQIVMESNISDVQKNSDIRRKH